MEPLLHVLVNMDGMPVLNTDRTFIMCAYEHEWNVYLLFIFALFTPFEFSENVFGLPIPTEEHVMALAQFEVNRP